MRASFFLLLFLFVAFGYLGSFSVRAAPPVLRLPQAETDGAWRLIWECESGATYRLERSFDLQSWTPVDTLTADGSLLTDSDTGAVGHDRAFWRVVQTEFGFRITGMVRTEAQGGWQLTWESRPGTLYRLERSFDLENWAEVGTTAAISDLTSLLDTHVAGQPKVFWRVLALDGDSEPVVVSSPNVAESIPGGGATWSVLVGGSEPIEKVAFVDDSGTEVGEAVPGFGSTWSLTPTRLPSDPPRAVVLHAEVTGADGTQVESDPLGILLADSEKFIPISDAGELLPGRFVNVLSNGTLGAFRYYPEGGAGQAVGVYFEFPVGARLVSTGSVAEIEFDSGTFFPGGQVAPVPKGPGSTRSLPVRNLGPSDVSSAFGLPSGPINLGWGNNVVKWTGGMLGSGGWKSLLVQLPFGEFPLPGGILNAGIVADPKSGELLLAVRCYGEWSPLDNGPLFRIPKSAPLTLRLSETGRFSADGTAEAEFPDGGKIRGAIVWRDPNFEFRFEGKAVVIPVLDNLRGILPTDPIAAAPADPSNAAALDSFSTFLKGCQGSIGGLAKGAGIAAPTTPDSTNAPPAAAPADPAGAALEAWSGRIVSWSGDRAGQLLSEDQIQDLTQVVAQSARLGEAAADLPTVLRLLRHLLAMADPLDSIRGSSEAANALAETVADSELRLFAAAQHIATQKTLDAASGELAETAALLGEIAEFVVSLEPQAARDAPTLRDSFAKLSGDCRNAVPSDIFARMGILAGDTTGGDNASLGAIDADALLDFLGQVVEMFEIQRAGLNGVPDIESLSGSSPPLYEAWRQIRDVYPEKEYELASPAMLARDFDGLRKALARRARYFELNARLGAPLSCNDPVLGIAISSPISTDALVDAFLAERKKRSGAMLAESCANDLRMFDTMVSYTTDGGGNSSLVRAIDQTFDTLALLGRDNGSSANCSPVYLALVDAGMHPDNPPIDGDSARTLRVSGEYENLSDRSPITLQINQAGRLILGRVQFHGLSTHKTHRERIVGFLRSETSDTAEFYILRRRENDTILGGELVRPGLLAVARTSSGMNLEVRPLPGSIGSPVSFIKTTDTPASSGVLADLFSGEARDVFLARQFSPLHSSQIAAVRDEAQPVIEQIGDYLATAGESTAERNAAAARVTDALGVVVSKVTSSQIPLARQTFREMLSRTNLVEGANRLSAWSWLRVIYSRHKADPGFDSFQIYTNFMGDEVAHDFSGNAFKYTIHISEEELGVDVVVASLGRVFLEITITKERSDGSGTPQTFQLNGAIGQVGGGWSVEGFPLSGGSGGDDIIVYSDIDYTADMLAGVVGFFGATASAGIGIIDFSYGPSMLTLYGDRTAPPFTIPLPTVSSDNHVALPSLELSAGMGLLTPWSEMDSGDLSLSAEPDDMSFDDEENLSGTVQFDVDSAELRPCGEASLRLFAAEMRAVFENTNATVSILGFTDATGTDAHNLELSQNRAESVKAALVALVGEGFAVPPKNIHAIGLGREPSMGRTAPNESQLNDIEQQFLTNKKAALPILADGEADSDWRSVTIILNNLVSIDLSAP